MPSQIPGVGAASLNRKSSTLEGRFAVPEFSVDVTDTWIARDLVATAQCITSQLTLCGRILLDKLMVVHVIKFSEFYEA